MKTVIKNGRVWIDDDLREVDLVIGEHGKITGSMINADPLADASDRVVDAAGCLVLPGGIDVHAHIQDGVETFYEGSCAAAAGGITTVVDMPPFHTCTTPAGVRERVGQAQQACVTDFGIHGGIVVIPEDLSEMPAVAEEGVAGFKVFMPAIPPVTRQVLWDAVKTAAQTGLRLMLHAEESALLVDEVDWENPLGFANARPPEAESTATAMVLEMALAAGAPVNICHVSAARTTEVIDDYKAWGVDVTAETTPHFLIFEKEDFHRFGAKLKTTPPLRGSGNAEILWQALSDGVLDMVVSDHFIGEFVQPDQIVSFKDKGPGIAGLEVSLPLLYRYALQTGRLDLRRFMQVVTENPADIFGFRDRKGRISPGLDADLIIFNPDEEWVVKNVGEFSRASTLPYEGLTLNGKIERTFVRGIEVWDGESIRVEPGYGKFVARK